MADEQDVAVVDLAEEAGLTPESEKVNVPVEGLITFDQLVMNFLQQHETAKEEYQ